MMWSDILDQDVIQDVYERACNKSYDQAPYPFFDELLSAFKLTQFEDVKIVIIGQDPYHGHNTINKRIVPQANGLAFSVDREIRVPPSLRNIFKELVKDVGVSMPKHGDLSDWAKQGVLLLNSVLTVTPGTPGSHANIGWEQITGNVITHLAERRDPVLFLLWGKKAKEIFQQNVMGVERKVHYLYAAHPSPFSAAHGFFGCKHFSKANEWLMLQGKLPINWELG